MMLRILAVLAVLAAVPAGAGVVCSSTTNSCQATGTGQPPRYATADLPTTCSDGTIAVDTTTSELVICFSNAWGAVGPAGTGITELNGLIGTSQSFAAPAAGMTISSATTVHTFALADDLAGVEGLAATGIATRTAASTWTTRTITGTANEITVTNGDGVAGAPTLSLPAAMTLTGKTMTGGDYAAADSMESYLFTAPADEPLILNPTSPATAASSAVGSAAVLSASSAVAGDTNAGAAAGGAVSITAGNAARFTSGDAAGGAVTITGGNAIGNANGGNIDLTAGSGSGSGEEGQVYLRGARINFDNPASPTVAAAGDVAFYASKWAASRGTISMHDGTAATNVVAVLNSDSPADGECPKWHTGGTVTWDTCAGGGISGLTTGKLPKAASSSTLDDSRLAQSGNDVTAAVGTGTAAAKIGGWLYTDATSTAGSVSDGSTHAFGSGIGDYTLPANTLSASAKGIRITAAVQLTTGSTINLYLKFGSATVSHLSAINKTTAVLFECTILRSSGASAQVSFCKGLRAESGYPIGINEGAVNADSGWVINETTEDATATIAIQLLYESTTDASKAVYKFLTVEAIQ